MIRRSFWQRLKKILLVGFRATLNFRKFREFSGNQRDPGNELLKMNAPGVCYVQHTCCNVHIPSRIHLTHVN